MSPLRRNAQTLRIAPFTGRRGAAGRSTARYRPRVDLLEERALPSTFTVTSEADAGPGSLRQAVLDANLAPGADVVRFAHDLRGRTIALTSGPITITDSLTLDGPGASRLTVRGGAGGLLIVTPAILAPDAPKPVMRVEGLTLADGRAAQGGAIFATQSALSVEDCAFLDNEADLYGGAIAVFPGFYLDEQSNFFAVPGLLAVRDSTFESNRTSLDLGGVGGALAIFDTPATIDDSAFTDNSAPSGGAISRSQFFVPDATLAIDDCWFEGNTATPFVAQGGAITSSGGDLTISDSHFEGNSAMGLSQADGGAVYAGGFGSVAISRSRFRGNFAESTGLLSGPGGNAFGGAINADGPTSISIGESEFEGNRASGPAITLGGAIRASAGSVRIAGSRFVGNTARGIPVVIPAFVFVSVEGGAVSASGGPLTVEESLFRDNLAVGADSAFADGGTGLGGAISATGSSLDLSDSRFEGNEARGGRGGMGAPFGGGLALGGAVEARLVGAATIVDCSFLGNTATGGEATRPGSAGGFAGGGGILLNQGAAHTLDDNLFIKNNTRGGTGATGGAGGDAAGGGLLLFESTTATVSDALFAWNDARGGDSPDGPAGNASGGAIHSAGDLTIRDSLLAGNRALGGTGAGGGDARGGGLFASGVLLAENLVVTGNKAFAGPTGQGLGGGVYIEAGTAAVIRRSRIRGNRASTAGDQVYGSFTT